MSKLNKHAPNLKTVSTHDKTYYYYVMPDGSREPMGTDRNTAIEAALALNTALRESGSLVERVLNKVNQTGTHYEARNPPMMQVIDEYIHNQLNEDLDTGKLSPQTYQAKMYILAEYNELIGNTNCQQVTTFDLAGYIKIRTGHVQQKHVPLLRKLFRYAIAQGYRDTNPANELEPKIPAKRRRQRHTWQGFQHVRKHAPAWLQRTMDIALYSLQRRADLLAMHKDHVDTEARTLEILQQKTRNYAHPVYIRITMGDALWQAVDQSLSSDIPCPYLVHCRPKNIHIQTRARKPHPFAVLPDYLSKQFRDARDSSGAYDHLPANQRPTLHDIRALGILMYHKAGYSLEYIMALAGHAKATTTEHYIAGHEQIRPIAVNADLSLDQVNVDEIDWNNTLLPPEIARLVDEGEK